MQVRALIDLDGKASPRGDDPPATTKSASQISRSDKVDGN
jgi:hypothetical protein